MRTILYTIIVFQLFVAPSFSQEIQYKNNTFSISDLDPPTQAAGAKRPAYWKFFWEFGDGNYSASNLPKYCYSESGTYTVRVCLTPHYSHDATKTITETFTIKADNNCKNSVVSGRMRGAVKIDTDAANELVPDNDIQVILEYQMPVTANQGYLIFLYNSDQEQKASKLSFSPLTYKYNPRLHGAKKMNAIEPTNMSIREKAKLYLLNQLNEEGCSAVGFECSGKPKEIQRVFLTISASPALDTIILKKKKDELITTLKAVFVPKNAGFDADKMSDSYRLKMLSVHDPNKLEVLPRNVVLYNRAKPQKLIYTVHFENKGGKAAERVILKVPWDQNLDRSSIEVLDRDPKETSVCPNCNTLPNYDPVSGSKSCFEMDTTQADTVYFTFHNVLLKREKGIGGREFAQGYVKFKVNSTSEKKDVTELAAKIVFEGGDEFETNTVRNQWKHQGIGLKIGRNIGGGGNYDRSYEDESFAGFDRAYDDFQNWFNIGIYQRRNYVRNGWTLFAGWEASVAGFGFEHRRSDLLFNDFEPTDRVTLEERISMQTLDLQAQTEYRIGGLLAVGAGGGLSIPLFGKGNFRGNIFSSSDYEDFTGTAEGFFDNDFIRTELFEESFQIEGQFRDEVESSFGLFNNRNQEDAIIFNEDVSSRFAIGGMMHWFIEGGLLSNVALGLRQDFRFYPNAYKQQCLKYNNFELYLRLNLVSASPRGVKE
ncbi:MAG: PKD domain-containing protein [Bacteroidota bacterium]